MGAHERRARVASRRRRARGSRSAAARGAREAARGAHRLPARVGRRCARRETRARSVSRGRRTARTRLTRVRGALAAANRHPVRVAWWVAANALAAYVVDSVLCPRSPGSAFWMFGLAFGLLQAPAA